MNKYDLREACCLCTTPYQLIGLISIVQECKLNADCYIFYSNPTKKILAEKLRQYNIFANIITVDLQNGKLIVLGNKNKLLQLLFPAKAVSHFLPNDISYAKYYMPNLWRIYTIPLMVLRKRNPDMDLTIYEDGMGTYMQDVLILNGKKKRRIAEKFLAKNLYNEKTKMMAHIPELVPSQPYLKNLIVEQMPRLNLNKATINMLEDVFSVNENTKINEKYIIFDVSRDFSLKAFGEDGLKILCYCYEFIARLVGNDIIYKPHPGLKADNDVSIKKYTQRQIPMEILYASMEDLEDRVLISFISTTMFTPKILFDKEPKVISLHRILNYMPFEQTFEKFRGIYRNKERVIAPNSIEELADVIKAF